MSAPDWREVARGMGFTDDEIDADPERMERSIRSTLRYAAVNLNHQFQELIAAFKAGADR